MDDKQLSLIASDPAEFRRNLIVRAAHGPALFSDIAEPFQNEILASIDAAFVAVREDRQPPITRLFCEATKGCGKDLLAAMSLLWLLAFCRRELTAQIGAADRSQADELRKSALSILRLNDWLADFVTIHNWAILNTDTGSRADIIPADESGSHGSRPDICVVNELVHHSDRGFAETMLDNATKVASNVSLILTNSGRRGSWQWDWRELARTSPRWAFHSYTKPAPWIDRNELSERRRSTSEARFRRLWLGEWVGDDESALTDAVLRAAIVLAGPRHFRESPDEQVFAGLDLAVSRDRSALAILTRSQGEKTKLAECRSWSPPRGGQIDLSAVEQAVLESHSRFNFFTCFYDPAQAELMAQRLRRAGVPMVGIAFTTASLQEMATTILEVFNSGEIELFDHHQLLTDLRQLKFVERGNVFRLDSTRNSDGHQDLATAFTLALLAARRNPFGWANLFVPADRELLMTMDDLAKRCEKLDLPSPFAVASDDPATPHNLAPAGMWPTRPDDPTRPPTEAERYSAALAENNLLDW